MKVMKASICVAVTALALSLSVIVPSCAEQDPASRMKEGFAQFEASRLNQEPRSFIGPESTRQRFRWPSGCWPFARRSLVPIMRWSRCR
jgi:hypothetical protein